MSYLKKFRIIALLLILCLIIDIPAPLLAKSNKNKLSFSGVMESSTKDQLLGLGIAAIGIYAGGWGNKEWTASKACSSFSRGMVTSVMASSLTRVAVNEWGFSPGEAQIFGSAVIGGMAGGWNSYSSGGWGSIAKGAGWGSLQGASIAGGGLLAYNALKGTSLYKENPYIGNQLVSLVGGFIGSAAVSGLKGVSDKYFQSKNSSSYKTAFWNGIKTVWNDPLAGSGYLLRQSAVMGLQYAAAKIKLFGDDTYLYTGFNTLLSGSVTPGKSMLSVVGDTFLHMGLAKLGGEYDYTGKNNWGLTPLQMNTVLFAGTGIIRGVYDKLAANKTFWGSVKDSIARQAENLIFFGGTTLTDKGNIAKMGLYIEKISQFSGVSDYKYRADNAMKTLGYTSWAKFVKAGRADSLSPNFMDSLVKYTSANLQDAAVQNLSGAIMSGGSRISEWFKKKSRKIAEDNTTEMYSFDSKVFPSIPMVISSFSALDLLFDKSKPSDSALYLAKKEEESLTGVSTDEEVIKVTEVTVGINQRAIKKESGKIPGYKEIAENVNELVIKGKANTLWGAVDRALTIEGANPGSPWLYVVQDKNTKNEKIVDIVNFTAEKYGLKDPDKILPSTDLSISAGYFSSKKTLTGTELPKEQDKKPLPTPIDGKNCIGNDEGSEMIAKHFKYPEGSKIVIKNIKAIGAIGDREFLVTYYNLNKGSVPLNYVTIDAKTKKVKQAALFQSPPKQKSERTEEKRFIDAFVNTHNIPFNQSKSFTVNKITKDEKGNAKVEFTKKLPGVDHNFEVTFDREYKIIEY